ncbi:unconventional myosin-IXb isoform X5 [Anabas testudineus]|uniref:unconventional myosin-IXb isoform X5 n=1 Tax=Anabas testudineus TaxID=64144 RepID=UPI000E457CB8|nr:unconventional myosin-IXb isoform X5 [Anabas testudineus]
MSTTDGARTPEQDGQVRVVQIYPRLSQDTAVNCLLQISATDTAKTVIHNTVATLGLDSNQGYSLLEVRNSRKDERLLDARHYPLQRVLLWPPEAQKWHPQSQGYYFILQQQQQQQQATSGEDEDKSAPEQNDDLCNLETLTEENVLQVLRQRFHRRKIYTYARNILIAVNPNKVLPVYYNPKYVKMYENQPLGKLSPHIFAMADVAFNAMLNRQVNQCIVISGESGSGKTESSSYLIHCLIALSQKTYSSGLERTILGAGPVLEAFGNAKTAENNNSSRFGKFIQLNYLESGVIRGAVIEKYLLEKNRLVSRDKNQRNYHVFYYLLAGASKDEQDEFHLLKPQDYLYLKQKELCLDDEDKLGNEYKKLHQAMEMVGFLPSTKKHIFSILSAILHLGNVTYTLSEDSQDLEVGPADVLSTLCDLLKVKKDHLVKALTKKRIVTAKATIVSPYTLQKASKIRDSMAESLYSALFDWIVLHINHSMLNRRDMEDSVSCLSIGVLDLFGFENLQINSLEQLCINFASEKLQYYINQNLFKLEQEEYVSEGITWQNINYTDNSGCVELISRKSTGLFDLLDKESSLPQATDETLLDKLKQHHQDNPLFVLSPNRKSTFTIQHFAGRVNYDIKDFREKNTEHMRPEVVSLLRSSERAFVPHLVASNPIAQFRWGILRATIRILTVFKMMGRQRAQQLAIRRSSLKSLKDKRHRSSALDRLSSLNLDFSFDCPDENPLDVFEDIFANFEMRKKIRGSRKKQVIPKNLMDLRSLQHVVSLTAHDQTSKSIFHPQPRTRPLTMSTQFQTSLRKLMETIEKAEPFFIFCVRSNAKKKELQFDDELVLQQIRYTGLMQMVQVQKSGYSAKYTFKEFAKKFRILLPKQATVAHIKYLFERMELDRSTYQIGKTKVFLKEKERQLLQDTLNKTVMYHIVTLQRWFRVCLLRLHFLQRRDASKIIERNWREFYEYHNRAATVIQTAWRSSQKRLKQQHETKNNEGTSQTRLGRDSLKTKSFSVDDVSHISSSGPDILPSTSEIPAEPDGSRFCLPSSFSAEDMGHHESSHSPVTTPDRVWFLSRFLKKLAAKPTNHESPSDKAGTLPRYNQHPYYMTNQPTRTNRNPTIRISRATRAIDINASVDRMITNPKELRSLDEFLGNQVNELQTRIKKLSPTENIFFQATKEFRETIKGMYSLEKPQISYKDLMKGYHNTVSTLAGVRQEAEVPLVVNLFQSVLDGFIRGELKRMESDPTKATKTVNKRKNSKCVDLLDHLFNIYQVNVTQTCDACASYIRGMEKAYICSACNLICHKKCLNKIETHCSKRCSNGRVSGSLYFGVQVSVLISDTNSVPKVMEMLLLHVELNGLYTEGIYRKSGSACRAKELQQILDTDPESVCLENYPIHTITGLVKRWLRELPDPLMPFSLYSDFLHAVELPEKAERIRAIYQTIDELPPANYSTLERLIFHLVRVAKEEEHNKMSPGALAIVFAPCILRTPDSDDPLLCMKDVSKTTLCVEILICEQFRRYTEKMRNIKELEYAEALAVSQLKLKRQNTIAEQPSDQPSDQPAPEHMHPDETEKTLIERIKSIKQEKVDFVIGLPDLEQENSDNDNLESMSLMSLESEEDIRGNMEWEGKNAVQLKTQKPECPRKPPDIMQRVQSLTTDVTQSKCRQDKSSQLNQPQVTRKTFSGSLDDLDIPFIDEDDDQS